MITIYGYIEKRFFEINGTTDNQLNQISMEEQIFIFITIVQLGYAYMTQDVMGILLECGDRINASGDTVLNSFYMDHITLIVLVIICLESLYEMLFQRMCAFFYK